MSDYQRVVLYESLIELEQSNFLSCNDDGDDNERSLHIRLQGIKKEDLQNFATLLGTIEIRCNIQILELQNNRIGDYGIKLLSNVLETTCHTISALDLEANDISDEGCLEFVRALQLNPDLLSSIQSVNLRYNLLGDDGVVALLSTLKSSVCIKKLELRDNKIDTEGALAISTKWKYFNH